MASYGEGGRWRVKTAEAQWWFTLPDGTPVVHAQKYVMAKRRWAHLAIERMNLNKNEWLRFDVPGTNLVVFFPSPLMGGDLTFTAAFQKRAAAEYRELSAILSVPIEEADGTTVIEPPARKKGGRS